MELIEKLFFLFIALCVGGALLLALVGAWFSSDKTLTDHDLYGMDAEEYLKLKVGEEYYNQYYKKDLRD